MINLKRPAALAAAAVAVAALAACSLPSVESFNAVPVSATDAQRDLPQPAAAPAATAAADDPFASEQPREGACAGLPNLQAQPNSEDDRIFGYGFLALRDLGSIDHATGETTVNEDGEPVAYLAAPGDTMHAIAARFCIEPYSYLERLNQIRRGDSGALYPASSMTVYAGDTINLDPYTIATVGDENGVVRDNELEFHIPTQR